MNGLLVSLQDAVVQGVLWGIMVLGVYITYKLLDIADLTVDGSFALGGCVCAVMVLNRGMDPWAALIVAAAAGMVAGAVTGFLHTVFEIPAILAGILTHRTVVHQSADHGRQEQCASVKDRHDFLQDHRMDRDQ